MTEFEIVAKGQRAQQAEEFIGPILDDIRASYADRIVEIASKELDPKVRTDKLTALSTALRILDNLSNGLDAVIRDGEVAEKNIIKVENIEKLSPGRKRLLGIVPV